MTWQSNLSDEGENVSRAGIELDLEAGGMCVSPDEFGYDLKRNLPANALTCDKLADSKGASLAMR